MEGMSQEGSISFQLIYLIDGLYYCLQFCVKCDQGDFSCMHAHSCPHKMHVQNEGGEEIVLMYPHA